MRASGAKLVTMMDEVKQSCPPSLARRFPTFLPPMATGCCQRPPRAPRPAPPHQSDADSVKGEFHQFIQILVNVPQPLRSVVVKFT